jgi:hypothetical protein
MQTIAYERVEVKNLESIKRSKDGEVIGTRGLMIVRDNDNKFQWSGFFVSWGGNTFGIAKDTNEDATGGDVLFESESDANKNRAIRPHNHLFTIRGYHSKRFHKDNWYDQFVVEEVSAI